MARNYSLYEAAQIVAEGKDYESIVDIGKRYPYILKLLSSITAKTNEDFLELMSFIPDYISVNKVNKLSKDSRGSSEEIKEEDNSIPKPTSKRGRKSKSEPQEDIEEVEEVEADENDTDEDDVDDKYSGKSAMDLYKECKKRKIKVEAKQTAKYYADILREDDENNEEETVKEKPKKKPVEDDDDDDWDI